MPDYKHKYKWQICLSLLPFIQTRNFFPEMGKIIYNVDTYLHHAYSTCNLNQNLLMFLLLEVFIHIFARQIDVPN